MFAGLRKKWRDQIGQTKTILGEKVREALASVVPITLIVLIIAFALAVVWISKQGGWKGEGCGGNCASCHSRCENPDPNKH